MAYSGGAGLGHPGPGPGGASPPRPGQPSRPAVGSKAGPHGAIVAPYGSRMPVAKPGFMTIGTGKGGWIYKPNAGAAGGAKTPTGKGRGGGGVKFAGPGVALNNPILNPSKGLSGQSLYDAAKALADAQTQGPEAELANQIAQNNRQTTGAINLTGGYLNSLGGFAKQGVTDEQNLAQSLNTGLGMIGGGEQQALQGIGQNAQGALSKYTPGDPSTSAPAMQALTAELARQQALGAQETAAFKTAGALQGANYGGLAASALGSDALAGTAALKGIAQSGEVKNEPLNAKVAALKAQQGALLGTDLGKLRQQEIANQFTSKGLGLKQQGLALTAAQDQAKNALVARGQNLTARGQNITNSNNLANQQIRWAQLNQKTANDAASQAAKQAALNLKAAQSGKGGGGAKPLSTVSNNAWFGRLGEVEALINRAHSNGTKDDNTIRSALESGSGTPHGALYDPLLVETAMQLLGYGSIDRSQAALLHNAGLRGGSFRGAPIKVTANYHGPAPGTDVGQAIAGFHF